MGVRVTEAEAEELQERSQAARLSMGAYLRQRGLGQRVRMAAERRLGAAELRELNRIGVNLNHPCWYVLQASRQSSLVLEGVRLCAMRNRGYWHGIYEELLQEKRRPVTPEEVQDRLRTIQKERGGATYRSRKLHRKYKT